MKRSEILQDLTWSDQNSFGASGEVCESAQMTLRRHARALWPRDEETRARWTVESVNAILALPGAVLISDVVNFPANKVKLAAQQAKASHSVSRPTRLSVISISKWTLAIMHKFVHDVFERIG